MGCSQEEASLTDCRYSDHTYIVLTLQKLVHLHEDNDSGSDSDNDFKDQTTRHQRSKPSATAKMLRKLFTNKSKMSSAAPPKPIDTSADMDDPVKGIITAHTSGDSQAPLQILKTLQRYSGGPNQERMRFMEAHSALKTKSLAVSAEQVSIFLTSGKLSTER